MNNIVKIKKNSISMSKYGSITGIIYYDFDDFQFPDKNWKDFIVVIVSWWLEVLDEILYSPIGFECELDFMEGPQFILLKKSCENSLILECFDRDFVGTPNFSSEVSVDNFVNSLVFAANKLSNICLKENWLNDDIKNLRKSLDKLDNCH